MDLVPYTHDAEQAELATPTTTATTNAETTMASGSVDATTNNADATTTKIMIEEVDEKIDYEQNGQSGETVVKEVELTPAEEAAKLEQEALQIASNTQSIHSPSTTAGTSYTEEVDEEVEFETFGQQGQTFVKEEGSPTSYSSEFAVTPNNSATTTTNTAHYDPIPLLFGIFGVLLIIVLAMGQWKQKKVQHKRKRHSAESQIEVGESMREYHEQEGAFVNALVA